MIHCLLLLCGIFICTEHVLAMAVKIRKQQMVFSRIVYRYGISGGGGHKNPHFAIDSCNAYRNYKKSNLSFMWPCIVTNFFYNRINRRTNFPILFCQETLRASGSSSAHHQEFSNVHSALVYVMQVWWQLSCTTRMVVPESCRQTSAECTLENSWWWAEELPETCRVSWQK